MSWQVLQKIWKGGGFLFKRQKIQKENGIQVQIGEIRDPKGSDQTGWIWQFIVFFCYVSGVFGILYTFPLKPYLNYENLPVYITAFLYTMVLFIKLRYKNLWMCFAVLGGTSAILLLHLQQLPEQWEILKTGLSMELAAPSGDFTVGMQIFAICCSVLVQILMFQLGAGWVLFFYSIPILLLGSMIGQSPDLLGIVLFSFYHLGTSLSGNMLSGRRQTYPAFFKKSHMKTAGRAMYILLVSFSLCLGIAVLFTNRHMEQIFEVPMSLEQKIRQRTMEIFQTEENKGKVNRGNQYTSGENQMELILDEKPREPIYLKNYVGGKYQEGSWEEANDAAFYDQSAQNGQYIGRYTFENREFSFLQYAGDGDVMPFRLEIRPLSSGLKGYYIPYLSRYLSAEEGGYVYAVYTQEQFENQLEQASYENVREYQEREKQYGQFVIEHYLDVDRERLPRLTRLCREHPMQGQDNITAYIMETLHSQVSYTLNPGIIPFGEEIPEYFLFESKKGYCQHFATTAALMYRLYGIPSRYVSGYMAAPGDFEQREDGTWHAVLEDGDAHAWTEIYAEGQGWKVVDTTPSAEEETERQNVQEQENTTAQQDDSAGPEETLTEVGSQGIDQKDHKESFLTVVKLAFHALMVLLSIGLLIVLLWSRKEKKREEIKSFRADTLFVKMIEFLHFGGFLKGYMGMEKDFSERLTETVEDLSEEEASLLIRLVYRESYGKGHIPEEDRQDVYQIYRKVCGFVYQRLKCYQKWYVKYWKVYY